MAEVISIRLYDDWAESAAGEWPDGSADARFGPFRLLDAPRLSPGERAVIRRLAHLDKPEVYAYAAERGYSIVIRRRYSPEELAKYERDAWRAAWQELGVPYTPKREKAPK